MWTTSINWFSIHTFYCMYINLRFPSHINFLNLPQIYICTYTDVHDTYINVWYLRNDHMKFNQIFIPLNKFISFLYAFICSQNIYIYHIFTYSMNFVRFCIHTVLYLYTCTYLKSNLKLINQKWFEGLNFCNNTMNLINNKCSMCFCFFFH